MEGGFYDWVGIGEEERDGRCHVSYCVDAWRRTVSLYSEDSGRLNEVPFTASSNAPSMVISFTSIISSLPASTYSCKALRRPSLDDFEREVPRTEYPASRNAFAVTDAI